METKKSSFEILNAINCNEHTEKKNGLTYLSWAWAWQMVKKNFPDASYEVYETENGIPYFTDGKTCWVKTGVTINGQEHKEYLPIMDFRNNSVPVDKVTSMDMNKAIQRSLTKCCARHGLGLYIYAGEDLPDTDQETPKEETPKVVKARRAAKEKPVTENPFKSDEYKPVTEEAYWAIVKAYADGRPTKTGGDYRQTWIEMTNAKEGHIHQFDLDVENYRYAQGF